MTTPADAPSARQRPSSSAPGAAASNASAAADSDAARAALAWLHSARFLTTASRLEQLPAPDLPEIAFVGRSNAGKSSAINALAQHKRLAFSSRTPGRTQHINLFELGPREAPDARFADQYPRDTAYERGTSRKKLTGTDPDSWADGPIAFRTTWKETFAVLTQSTEKYQQILQTASQLYNSEPDWVTFFREILGLEGVVRRAFPTPELMCRFEQAPEYAEIQQRLAKLRARGDFFANSREPTRVITVRLPKSLHESLRAEAHERHTSMNKLCISKLLQMVDGELVPADA